jgi:5-hydroxyisourate hydrolase
MITTHVLDLSNGRPAARVRVSLTRVESGKTVAIGTGVTDEDGRLKELVAKGTKLGYGTFELTFETGTYFKSRGLDCFHPSVTVRFDVKDGAHYHVPLLISPFGYSTYRGS